MYELLGRFPDLACIAAPTTTPPAATASVPPIVVHVKRHFFFSLTQTLDRAQTLESGLEFRPKTLIRPVRRSMPTMPKSSSLSLVWWLTESNQHTAPFSVH
jgi:hypothetical protein